MPITFDASQHLVVHAPHTQANATAGSSPDSSLHGSRLPTKDAKKTPARTTITVRVAPGDSVYSLARTHHSSVAAIAKANPKVSFARLVPGTALKIPVPTQSASDHAASPTQPSASKNAKKDTKAPHPKPKPKKAYAPKPKHVPTYAGTETAGAYPKQLVADGDTNRRQLAQADLPTRSEIKSMIEATSKKYGVNPTLALAIAWQESGWQQSAVSVCDAVGTMQVMPTTSTWASQLAGRHLDRMGAQDNITAGVLTLRYLTEHAKDQDEAIGSYYQGLGAVREHGLYDDTKHYVASVNAHMKRFAK